MPATYSIIVVLLGVTAALDAAARRVPNAAVVAIATAAVTGRAIENGFRDAAAAVLVALCVGAVAAVSWRKGFLGGGDVKLAIACALWVGPDSVLVFVLAAVLLGGAVSALCYLLSTADARRGVRAGLTLVPGIGVANAISPLRSGAVTVPYAGAIGAAAIYAVWMGV
jgi:prepilin peptidase CpaA